MRSQGDRITVDRDAQPSSEAPIYVQILTSDGHPFKVIIRSEQNQYQLPGDEEAFNRLLATQPKIAYQILSLLASHGITAQIDQSHNFGIPELDTKKSGPTPPQVYHAPDVQRNYYPVSGAPPTSIRVGDVQFSFPRDWDFLREQVADSSAPAARIQRALEMGNIECPPHVFVVIYRNMLQDFDNKASAAASFSRASDPFFIIIRAAGIAFCVFRYRNHHRIQ